MKSKAQLKREKDLINRLTRTMNKQLRTFKNQYIGDFVNYEVNQISKIAKAFDNLDSITPIDMNRIKMAKDRMSILECLKVEFYAEANNSFNTKLEKLILKMVSSGIFNNNIGLNIERVGNAGNNFEILVYPKTRISRWKCDVQLTDEQVKQAEIDATENFFHARMIYACGEIVKPHFRFITTTRKSYR